MLAAYQVRVNYEIGDGITRALHRVLMKSALSREIGSYYLSVAVGTKGNESSFVFEAVKKKNKDLFFFGKSVTGAEEITQEEMDSYTTKSGQNKIVEKLFKRHETEFWRCGYCVLNFSRKDNCKKQQWDPRRLKSHCKAIPAGDRNHKNPLKIIGPITAE